MDSPLRPPSRRADLRGERCPYTFIKARLAIEEMAAGEVLEVILDFRPAWERVPASMKVLGHLLVGEAPGPESARTFRFRKGDEAEGASGS
ncbi:MAG: sulfurtransferase TusA family protein [Planctomycetia bacterium]|nr:sulfurtransferase TusA family protein [Planctomycetia bacterium]